MNTYAQNRIWSDIYLDSIRQIVGPLLLVTSSAYQDTQEVSDLVADAKRIACRVRRGKYREEYLHEFTIRTSGITSEMDKIRQGYGDWMLYAHSSGSSFAFYWLIDLEVFREYMSNADNRRNVYAETKYNNDGTCFIAYDIRKFPSNLVIQSGSYFNN